jgi:transposase-like protein
VVALGIDLDGTKHPLALVEGSTENATLARELLVGLRERGLDTSAASANVCPVAEPGLLGARCPDPLRSP